MTQKTSSIPSVAALFHNTWQVHNREPIFKTEWAKQSFYDALLRSKNKQGIQIFSYSLMPRLPHVTGAGPKNHNVHAFFKTANSTFAQAYNRRLKRGGQVFTKTYQAPISMVLKDYWENEPKFRQSFFEQIPFDLNWSSYPHYAHGAPDPLLTPPASYLAFGDTPAERQRNYRNMVDEILNHASMNNSILCHPALTGNPDWVVAKSLELMRDPHEIPQWDLSQVSTVSLG